MPTGPGPLWETTDAGGRHNSSSPWMCAFTRPAARYDSPSGGNHKVFRPAGQQVITNLRCPPRVATTRLW